MMFRKQVLSIGSGLQNLNKIEQLVEEISDFHNINNTYFGNILVAVTEAVKNAMVHGNGEDPDKTVTVIFESRPNGLFFSVRDQGKGFDPESIPNPTEEEEAEGKKTMKGIYLIRSLSDEVVFKENGSLVEISFTISSINYQLSVDRSNALKTYFHQNQDQKIRKED